jgi:DNA-binding transcriptional MerR regulator
MPRTASGGALPETGRPDSAWSVAGAPAPVYGMEVYGIGSVAAMLEVPQSTLRTWEQRYGVVSPHRTAGGHRLYTLAQVEQLRHVLVDIAGGASAADAHRALARRMSTPSASPHARSHQSTAILVAERDQHAGKLLEDVLRPDGFAVELTLDVDAAKRSFERNRQELSIVEFLMPAGGEALCRWLKEQAAPAVLVVSELDVADRALGAGADAFLRKPLAHTRLRAVVRELLGIDAIPDARG